MDEVVLGVPVGGRVVGIVRSDAGELVFGGRLDSGGGRTLTDFRPHAGVVEGRTVVAGLLAPGAVAVVVIDDRGDEFGATVGDGVWVAVCGGEAFSEPLVRFSDPAGSIVAWPIPAGARRPVVDADEECPVCGAVAWIDVDGRDERFEVRCERCGLPVAEGALSFSSGAGEDEPADGHLAEHGDLEEDCNEEWEQPAALRGLGFPVYAVAGRTPSVGGWSGGGDEVEAVDVRHAVHPGRLEVGSADRSRDATVRGLRHELADLLIAGVQDDERSEAALEVRWADAVRTARRRAARAAVEERTFTIDGVVEPFAFAAVSGAWIASRDHYGVQVTITAHDVDPATVALERLADPSDVDAGTTAEASLTARRRAAAGDLLRREEVAALVDACGLGEHQEAILDAVLAGYRLEPGGTGRSRIGGLPDMAAGETWPHGPDGIPYTFVAQIDCSALPPLGGDFAAPAWDHSGALLRIFAALDARVPEPGPALGLAVAPDEPVTRASLPPRPDPMPHSAWEPDDESLRMLRETPVRAVPFLTTAVGWYVLSEDARDLASSAYRDFAARLTAGGAAPLHLSRGAPQLLGHAESVQGEDPRHAGGWVMREAADLQSLDAWRVLLNVSDGYEGMTFGDGGALAIVVPAADLAGGRYDRLVIEPSMG